MEKIRVLIIINNLGVGGAEKQAISDANEMFRLGIDVKLVTLRSEPLRSLLSELHIGQNRFICIDFRHFFDLTALNKLRRYIREFNPSLIVSHLWLANTVSRTAAILAGKSNIISFEQNVYDGLKTSKMFFVDWCLQFFTRKIIAVSEAVKKSLTRHGIERANIDVLRNSVEISKFSGPNQSGDLRKEFNIPPHGFLCLFVGRLISQKAVDVLINSLALVGTDVYLLIAGQGNMRSELEEQAKRNNLNERVIFAGVRNDVPRLLASSDCFVLPSRYEGSPLILLEAMASGASIIVSDFESAKEIIQHMENGLVVAIEDTQALAGAITLLMSDKELRKKLSLGARKSVEKFSTPNHVHAILRYINSGKL